MKRKATVRTGDLRFEDLTSRQQRADLNALLCERLGAPPGTEIACRDVSVQRRGGIYWADLRADWAGASLAFNVKWLNRDGAMEFSEGWRLAQMRLYSAA
ncbi:MAG: hypothetical protein LBB75_00505 [Oscillospiraceae bacterium]|nr:hypothetical protein [Oscillospiraceae bacterium]